MRFEESELRALKKDLLAYKRKDGEVKAMCENK